MGTLGPLLHQPHNVKQQLERCKRRVQRTAGVGRQLDVEHAWIGRLEVLLLGHARYAHGRPCA